MKSLKLPRRDLLKALGLSAGLVPLLDSTRSFGGALYPVRLITLVKGNGTLSEEFWPKGDGEDLTKKTLPQITAPLEPWKANLIFPEGLNLRNWSEGNPYGRSGDAHHNYGSLLTGTYIMNGYPQGAYASSESVDSWISNQLPGKGVNVPIKLVTSMAMRFTGNDGYVTPTWKGRGQPVTPENNPYKVFSRLFAGSAMASPGDVEAMLKRGRSLLDFLGRDVEKFGRNLGRDDKAKVEAHLQMIRDREKELVAGTLPAQPGCQPTKLEQGVNVSGFVEEGKLPKMHIDLIVDAMKCDLTRTATLVLTDSNQYEIFYEWLGDGFGKGLGKVSEFPERHGHSIAHGARGAAKALKIKVERWNMQQLAYLLERLQKTPEGDGTMLDNTIVLYVDTLNEPGGHSTLNMPWILAGGGGGYFKTGRHLKLSGAAQNGLLVALCNAMGTPPPDQTFGDPKWGKGEMPRLRG